MRYGVAIDLHAPASAAEEVSWARVSEQVLLAERLGFDLVVFPDHLSYPAGGENGYSVADEPVGVREAVTFAAAAAAITETIRIGHSVINAPYRPPALVAHIAAGLADISGGRYSLGIGVGNTFDYEQIGVAADRRVARFEECVEIVSEMLRVGMIDKEGEYWSARHADLAFRPSAQHRPPIVVAAGGPRTMRAAVRFGDCWNAWVPTDPDGSRVATLLTLLEETCDLANRDPASIQRTVDVAVDPLNLSGVRARSEEALKHLGDLGVDEVRCYLVSAENHRGRLEAIEAFADLVLGI